MAPRRSSTKWGSVGLIDGTELQNQALRLWTSLADLDDGIELTLPQRFDKLVTDSLGQTISRYILDDELVQA